MHRSAYDARLQRIFTELVAAALRRLMEEHHAWCATATRVEAERVCAAMNERVPVVFETLLLQSRGINCELLLEEEFQAAAQQLAAAGSEAIARMTVVH